MSTETVICTPSFNSSDKKEKFKFVLNCTDSYLSKICIEGMCKMF